MHIMRQSACLLSPIAVYIVKLSQLAWDFQSCGMCDQQMLRSACAYAQSDQSLCSSIEYSMSVKLLTEHHLEFLRWKGGWTGSSESTHVKMPHCWKSHVAAHIISLRKVTCCDDYWADPTSPWGSLRLFLNTVLLFANFHGYIRLINTPTCKNAITSELSFWNLYKILLFPCKYAYKRMW